MSVGLLIRIGGALEVRCIFAGRSFVVRCIADLHLMFVVCSWGFRWVLIGCSLDC